MDKFNSEENKDLEESLEVSDEEYYLDEDYGLESNEDYELDEEDCEFDEDDIFIDDEDDDIYEEDFELDEDSIDTSDDFFNGSNPEPIEPLSFNDGEDDFFGDFDDTPFRDNLFGDDPFESTDNREMKKFLSKWFKIFAGLGVCLTVLGVLLNNVLKRK